MLEKLLLWLLGDIGFVSLDITTEDIIDDLRHGYGCPQRPQDSPELEFTLEPEDRDPALS